MEIKKSTASDLEEMVKLYAQARKFMEANGNPTQWGKNYPERFLLERDIEQNHSYVCKNNDEIVGTFFYYEGIDPTYIQIYEGKWLNEDPYGVVHRITSGIGKRGVASFCLDWCVERCGNIRIDTHRNNRPMQSLLKKNGFQQCGIIYLENGDERIAFQKTK